MSSGPRTVVDVSMCGADVAPKVGYMNGSDGATPLCRLGTFSGACFDYHRSFLISLSYLAMHATNGMAGTARRPLS